MKINDDLIRDLYSDFTKEEVFEVAKEVGVDYVLGDRVKVLLKAILTKIIEDKPKTGKLSNVTFEFLVAAEVIDDIDGKYIYLDKPDIYIFGDDTVVVDEGEKVPACFGCADAKDPSCSKCKVFDNCVIARVANRPPCFGEAYFANSNECILCIEALNCNAVILSKK
jgi:hypothetical protein